MTTVPLGGLILVTGANGSIGSVAIKFFLDKGYAVRGTVRSLTKHEWMLSYFGPKFSLVEVPDLNADGAFDEAVKGVDGIAHIAVGLSLTLDTAVVDQARNITRNLLETAAKEPRVKRIVITSSQSACINTCPGIEYSITANTWNEISPQAIKEPLNPDTVPERMMHIYATAKLEAERTAWRWVNDHKPHYVLNTIVPNVNMGTAIAPEKLGFGNSTALIRWLVNGNPLGALSTPSQWFVNTEDDALLHLAALTIEQVQNERIFAFAGRFTWTRILEIIRQRYPDRQSTLAHIDEPAVDRGEVENGRAEELLRIMGQDGFKTLEETVASNMEAIIRAEKLADIPRTRTDDMMDALKQLVQAKQNPDHDV